MELEAFGPKPRSVNFIGFDDDEPTPSPQVTKPQQQEIEKVVNNDYSKLVDDYKRDGFVVVPNILTEEEVKECRRGFHEDLKRVGVDYQNLKATVEEVRRIQTHPSGGMPFHYSPWRTKYCTLNKKLFEVTQSLWKYTWAISAPGFECPYAPFEPSHGYAFVDSLNFRLPSSLIVNRVQRTIGPHIDINPWNQWGGRKGEVRWRPFQGFIALTDHKGGFMACPGFHLKIDEYFENIPCPPNHTQGYISLQSSVYSDIHSQMIQVHYKPGDAVLWDWRLVHRITEDHPGRDTREVVYTSFLPDIPLNRKYVRQQLEAFQKGKYPPEFMREEKREEIVPGWDPIVFQNLTEIDEKLLGIHPWN